jgi:hypothetical protein
VTFVAGCEVPALRTSLVWFEDERRIWDELAFPVDEERRTWLPAEEPELAADEERRT